MTAPPLRIAVADAAAAAAIKPVIERAYRGDSARGGWTHEADLLDGERIAGSDLEALAKAPASRLLVAWDGADPVGSVAVTDRGGGLAYLGLLAIDPRRQAGGIGRALIASAEACARDAFTAHTMEMTVIAQRAELIAWYIRRGYALTGETRAFPTGDRPDLPMSVLAKPLH